jgi:platelet-activating factor acetylhydrolase IB subunit beta/gamma
MTAKKKKDNMPLEAIKRTDEHHIAKHSKILGMKYKDDIKLVFLGDSLTRRWEDNFGIWNMYFAAFHPVNFGVGSDSLENIKWRILNDELEGINPKVIVLLAGTNNLDKDPEEVIVSGIEEIVGIIQAKLKDTKIVVLGLLPRNHTEAGKNYVKKIARINQLLTARFAVTEITFKDIGAILMNEKGRVSNAIMPDGLHLNDKGYELIGPELRKIIEGIW